MAHSQQAQRIQTPLLRPALPIEVVVLHVEEVGETSTARVEDEVGPCTQMTGIDITMHVIGCRTDLIAREAAQGTLYDEIEIRVMSVIENSTGENATQGLYRGSTTLILVRQAQNQDRGLLIRIVEARRLIQDIFLVLLQVRFRILLIIRLLTDMDRPWIPTLDVLQSQQRR
jgi:hypothetical protein